MDQPTVEVAVVAREAEGLALAQAERDGDRVQRLEPVPARCGKEAPGLERRGGTALGQSSLRGIGELCRVARHHAPLQRVVERGPEHHAAVDGGARRQAEEEARGDELPHVVGLELGERDRTEERDEVHPHDPLVGTVRLGPEARAHRREPLGEELGDGRPLVDGRQAALEVGEEARELLPHLTAGSAIDRLCGSAVRPASDRGRLSLPSDRPHACRSTPRHGHGGPSLDSTSCTVTARAYR